MHHEPKPKPYPRTTYPSVSELLQIRRDKLAALQQQGQNPFLTRDLVSDIHAQEIHEGFDQLEGKEVCIAGRIMSWRDMGKASFLDLHDRTDGSRCM